MNDEEIEKEVDRVYALIERSPCYQDEPRSTTLAFLAGLAKRLESDLGVIEEEHKIEMRREEDDDR